MTPIRTLIVDDEPLARKRMRTMLASRDDVHVVAECCDGQEAVSAIRQWNPELIFLDIQMPALDGFEVVEAIDPRDLPAIIFVTAFIEHAVKAFEVNALDYLLKPYDADRLGKAIGRAHASRGFDESEKHDFEQRIVNALDQLKTRDFIDRLAVKSGDRLKLVVVEDIEWIEASGNYARIHTGEHQYLLRETMKGLEHRLDPKKFIRIHRSTIVNVDSIESLELTFHGDYQVCLGNGNCLPLSRNYRHALRERFGDQI